MGYIKCKTSVPTLQRTQTISIRKTKRLKLFREILGGYSKDHTKRLNTMFVHKAAFLGAFEKLQKETISFGHVCLSAWNNAAHWTDFH
jgi:hypothetical protein